MNLRDRAKLKAFFKETTYFSHVTEYCNKLTSSFYRGPLNKVRECQVEKCATPAGISLLKVNNRNTRTRCKICLKVTMKTPERRLSIANFEHVIAGWDRRFLVILKNFLNNFYSKRMEISLSNTPVNVHPEHPSPLLTLHL